MLRLSSAMNLLFCYKSAKDVLTLLFPILKMGVSFKMWKTFLKSSDTKQLDFFFFSAGDVPVNGTSVSMESSQFSSEVLVTQVNIIMFLITFFCFIYIYKYTVFFKRI